MNTKDVLIAARKKIERPECWTKGYEARDADGRGVLATNERAACWCVYGAIEAVVGQRAPNGDFYDEAVDALRQADPSGTPSIFNDHPDTTHADVLALFDRAIAACKEE